MGPWGKRQRDRDPGGPEGRKHTGDRVPGVRNVLRTSFLNREEKGTRSGLAACPSNFVPISGSGQEVLLCPGFHTHLSQVISHLEPLVRL